MTTVLMTGLLLMLLFCAYMVGFAEGSMRSEMSRYPVAMVENRHDLDDLMHTSDPLVDEFHDAGLLLPKEEGRQMARRLKYTDRMPE